MTNVEMVLFFGLLIVVFLLGVGSISPGIKRSSPKKPLGRGGAVHTRQPKAYRAFKG
jgi:hypothetical protein